MTRLSRSLPRRRSFRPNGAAALVAVVLAVAGPAAASAAVLPADTTAILSGTPDLLGALPTPVASANHGPRAVSSSGRTVAFVSTSDGLLAGDDDTVVNTYAKDLATGRLQLVGRASGADGAPAHRPCGADVAVSGDGAPAISADGRWVAFVCSDALDPADTNGLPDVYLRDLDLETTTLISRASKDGPVGERSSTQPTVDANGEHVAWTTASTFGRSGFPAVTRVYRRTVDGSRATEIVGPETDLSGARITVSAQSPSIDGDGGRVAFTTAAALVADDTNGTSDVYVADERSDSVDLISRLDRPLGAPGNGPSFDPHLSQGGGDVAFTSRATNLVPADRDEGEDAYVRFIGGFSRTTLISHTPAGARANGPSQAVGIDATGQVVAFRSQATDLDPADRDPGRDAYVARGGGTPVLASRRDGAAGAASNTLGTAALSADGDHLALGTGGGLTDDADPRASTVSLRDLPASRTRPVARPQADGPFVNDGGDASDATLSADGRFAAFVTLAPGLGLPNAGSEGVVVRDLETGAVTLASREDGPDGAPLTGRTFGPRLSADGSRVLFSVSGQVDHLFVRDLRAGRTLSVDRADGPDGVLGAKDGSGATITDDGQRVAFSSLSGNLVGGVTDNGRPKVFVRDLAASRTLLASRADGPEGASADDGADSAVISGDGRSVAFSTSARNLGDGDTDATLDVHLRRLDTGRTLLVSATGAGVKGDGSSQRPSLSRDGTRVAFESTAQNFDAAAPGRSAIYVRDLADGTLTLAGRADGPGGAPISGDASGARLSADGGSVAFGARPTTSIAPGDPGDGVTRGYLRRIATGTTRLITRASGPEGAPAGEAADVRVDALSADGGCVAFGARGDLAPGGSRDVTQVFLRTVSANCGRPVPPPPGAIPPPSPPPPAPRPPLVPKAGDRTPPRLTSVRLSRTRLRVGPTATAVAARTGQGTTLSLRSSEAAKLTITLDRERQGRRTGSKRTCRVTSGRVSKGACTVRTRDGVLRRSLRGGSARFALSGRIGKRRLALGRHRLTLVARDAASNASRPVTLRFTIVR